MVVGGSSEFVGAPWLAALSSLYGGVDLVYLAAPAPVLSSSISPEIIPIKLHGERLVEAHVERLVNEIVSKRVHVLVLGPGAGRREETINFFCNLYEKLTHLEHVSLLGIVVDADALYSSAQCLGHLQEVGRRYNVILTREEAYIGVLIDDLTTHPIREPYRMLTSRSEYRLVLRSDNAALRLSKRAYELGILTEDEYRLVKEREELLRSIKDKMKKTYLNKEHFPFLKGKTSAYQILKRPEIHTKDLEEYIPEIKKLDNQGQLTLEIDIKYDGYIKRDLSLINEAKKLSNLEIPQDIDYDKVPNLSREGRDYLKEFKPLTLGQASRIPGVSSSDIVSLMLYIKRIKGLE
ncbi:MAG TPA: hypothetical protein EYP08_06915 [Pyrodictiaceae archaeon]|nr:hypothetical protein [Pyrodictiaceae archaeon]